MQAMEPWKEDGQIWSGVALHTWRLLKDYEEIAVDWPEQRRNEVTLWLCTLQNLLTVCTELIYSLHQHKALVMTSLDHAVEVLLANPDVQYTFTKAGQSNDRKNAASTKTFLKNLRNALSHPRTINSNIRTTGYETSEGKSGLIESITFLNSPDVTSSAEPTSTRLKDPAWDVSMAGYWTTVVPKVQLGEFVEAVALALAQPALGNWDKVPPLVPERLALKR